MNTSGRPLTKPTRSARRLYSSPVTQNCRHRQPVVRRRVVPVDEPDRHGPACDPSSARTSTFAPSRSRSQTSRLLRTSGIRPDAVRTSCSTASARADSGSSGFSRSTAASSRCRKHDLARMLAPEHPVRGTSRRRRQPSPSPARRAARASAAPTRASSCSKLTTPTTPSRCPAPTRRSPPTPASATAGPESSEGSSILRRQVRTS